MTTTLALFQSGVCEEFGNLITGTTTSAGVAGGTTFIDTSLALYPDDEKRLMESYFMPTSGTYAGIERQITDWVNSTTTGTTRAFAGQIAASVTYKIMPFAPSKITEKGNDAIKRTKYMFRVIRDDSTSTREGVRRYAVPTAIIKDPLQIWISESSFSLETVDDCEAVWTAGTNVTASLDNLDFQEGEGSLKLVVAAGATATQILAYHNITSMDLSDHIGLKVRIKSSVATAAGDLRIDLSETANGASPTETLSVPALVAGKWQEFDVSYAAATTSRDAIISVALYQVTDIGAATIWVDSIESITNNPAETLSDIQGWDQLMYWQYEADGHKVYFPYNLPGNRKLRMVGKGYLTAFTTTGTFATDQASTTEADEPEISHLYAMTLQYLLQDQYMQAVGADKEEVSKNIAYWASEADTRGRAVKLNMPRRTQKIPTYTYYGGIGG